LGGKSGSNSALVLVRRQPSVLSPTRLKQVADMIRRAVDPDAPWAGSP